jgi:8-oxo-dGTP pyrophosphatase MutT (NUDIX family)
MSDEVVDVIDEKDRINGQAPKAVVHRQGLRHRVAAVLLQRADGKYLIPTASRIKAEAGLLYHSAAGHVLSGESYVDSARRELQEETGLSAEPLEYLGAFWFEKEYPSRTEKESFRVYRATYRRSMGPVRLNEEQVNEQWLSTEELEAVYRNTQGKISAPLLMTCKHIFGFENERERVMVGEKKTTRVTVYFGCSMLGGYALVSREELAGFPKLIEELGYRLASDHQTQPGVLEREAKLEPTLIHDRDYQWLLDSDVGVFEISNPSLGVGSEISDMIYAGKPVLMLFKEGLEERISAYLRGKAGSKFMSGPIQCRSYRNLQDAGARIRDFIERRVQEPVSFLKGTGEAQSL